MAREVPTTAAELVPTADAREVLARAEHGDRTALPDLRRVLDASPRIWQAAGDLAAHAEAAWVELVAGDNLFMGESLCRKIAAMQAELAGPSPSPLERLLVARVTACWVQVHYADAVSAQAKGRDLTTAQLDHLVRRQERAQRGYLGAIKALALVRKLLPPAATPLADHRPAAATAVEPAVAGRDRPARPRKARPDPAKGGRRGTSKAAAKGPDGSRREAVIPGPLRERLRGMVGSKN